VRGPPTGTRTLRVNEQSKVYAATLAFPVAIARRLGTLGTSDLPSRLLAASSSIMVLRGLGAAHRSLAFVIVHGVWCSAIRPLFCTEMGTGDKYIHSAKAAAG
jgi:hypothetical protein